MRARPADIIDLFVYVVVLNLAIEYVPSVISESFSLSLLTAALLKVALELVLLLKSQILWASSGRRGDAHLVADLAPGATGSAPNRLTCISSRLAFTADDGRNGRELWTVASARSAPVLHDLAPAGGSRPSRLTRVGHTLYFPADDGTYGREPWALRS